MRAMDKYMERMRAGREKKEELRKALTLRPEYIEPQTDYCKNRDQSRSKTPS
jgi:hypothetical protein